MEATQVAKALSSHYHQEEEKYGGTQFKVFFEVKTGSSWLQKPLILDAVAVKLSYARPEIRGYEIKVSRSDFLADQKWMQYVPYCHNFSFICPTGLIKKSELPEQVGLVEVSESGGLHFARRAKTCNVDVKPGIYQYLVFSRLENGVCPFHVEKKKTDCQIAKVEAALATKSFDGLQRDRFIPEVGELLTEVRKELSALRSAKEDVAEIEKFVEVYRAVLQDIGIYHGRLNGDLEELIRGRMSQIAIDNGVDKLIDNANQGINNLRRALQVLNDIKGDNK